LINNLNNYKDIVDLKDLIGYRDTLEEVKELIEETIADYKEYIEENANCEFYGSEIQRELLIDLISENMISNDEAERELDFFYNNAEDIE